MTDETPRVAVIGLGYVGLPVAAAFGRLYDTVGFDIDTARVAELGEAYDRTRELEPGKLRAATGLRITCDDTTLADRNVYVVTVPTPVTDARVPEFGPLLSATRTVGRHLQRGDLVIYESTVYPGTTEERCVPILETLSGLQFNDGFYVGYSPERANPGDTEHTLDKIVKVVAGSTPAARSRVAALYGEIITAGVFEASSLAVAEAAKVIENVQRDINVALVNELAMIFARLGLDTTEVLAAAGTKWNFLPFKPGLVGGHCIGVDPYYLTYKAQAIGYHPEMILAGRRINDSMGRYVCDAAVRLMLKRRIQVDGARALVLGVTFKEDCPDIRNTRVIDIVTELADLGVWVDVHDPWPDREQVRHELELELIAEPARGVYDTIIVAVGHGEFRERGVEWLASLAKPAHVIYDVKHCFPASTTDGRL